MADENRSNTGQEEPVGSQGSPSGGETAEQRARRDARRRILAGGLAGAPLLMTLTSRPALANVCSISGMQSGNLSAPNTVTCQGLTPGYWKTHEQQCSNYYIVGACNPIYLDHGQCDDYSVPTKNELQTYINNLKTQYPNKPWKWQYAQYYLSMMDSYPAPTSFFGTLFSDVFGTGYTTNPNTSLMQALWLDDTPPLPPDGSGGSSPVLAHCAAAWLNANRYGEDAFGLSPQGVIDMVHARLLTDPFGLKDDLEMLNSRA